ncbi:CoA-transferase family III domain-containing protein [Cladochytrium replicatum]|nr:CoA-transferase family III domain-containing protein [Cladochytrium replicatum]
MEVESLSAVLKIAVKRLWASIHGDPRVLGAARLHLTDSGLAAAYNLPSAFHVLPFAQACVAATVLQARQLDRNDVRDTTTVTVRPLHAGIHFRSERHIRLRNPLTHEEVSPGELWDPFSGDYQTREPGGWVRLHCNFAHHRNAALQSVGLSESSGATREDVQKACAERDSEDIERAVLELGGAAAKLRSMSEWKSSPAYATLRELRDVVTIRRVGAGQGPAHRWVPPTQVQDGEWRPLAGLRVLDLTRVLAGPVCGRILRALGASVLHVSSPHLPAIPAADVDTSFGKRSTFVDLDTAEGVQKLRELVRDADVVLQSYRPGALQARGFGLEDIVKENPNVVYLSVSAYGSLNDGEADPEIVKWSHRRGFDR